MSLHVNLNTIPSLVNPVFLKNRPCFMRMSPPWARNKKKSLVQQNRRAHHQQSVGTNEEDATGGETTDVPLDVSTKEVSQDEVNIEQETTEATLAREAISTINPPR